MRKITFFVFICFMLLFPMGLIFAQEHSSREMELAPLNPDFLKYRENVKNFKNQLFTDDGYPLGYIPPPVLLSNGRGVLDKRVMMSYPSQYDLRTKNKLTPIKNQDGCGACWTFAAMASLESYLMPTENRDFSEQHMNANHGFDYAECEGGNDLMSTAYLARWDGPLNESDVPYPYSFSGVNANTVQKHVQQVIFISDRVNSLDNDTVKYFITNYGAVKCSFYYRYSDYNSTHNSYYTSATCKNHGVVIIGWDDNYPAYKFNTQPPGNGAFIAKNSWGTYWGDEGYFYISYYDTSLGSFKIFKNVEPSSNYQRVYQYDPLGWTMTSWGGSFTAWGANIFTAKDSLPIRAVGFYLTDVKVKYEIHIYKGVKAGKPRSGTLAAKKIGSKTYSGYYTEKLDSSVSLTKGTKFSVVIKFTNTSFKYPVAVEYPLEDYSSKATANAGESYFSRTGSTWNELSQNKYNTNVCIKVFAGGGSSGGTPRIDCSRKTLNFGSVKGGNTTISQSFRISNRGSGPLNWTVSPSGSTSWLKCSPISGTNTGTVSVSVDTTGLSAGTYTDYLYVSASNASNSPQTVTVKLAIKNSAQAQVPFGEFATPIDSSTVMSSVPVTGWVLDDIEVVSVKIYNGSNYIGDAVFVEGARPDVELAYPGYPLNYRAGWGYMLLTYFLPNGGNGTYTIYAKAKVRKVMW